VYRYSISIEEAKYCTNQKRHARLRPNKIISVSCYMAEKIWVGRVGRILLLFFLMKE
jgi:hypothetical protein